MVEPSRCVRERFLLRVLSRTRRSHTPAYLYDEPLTVPAYTVNIENAVTDVDRQNDA